MSVNRKEWIKFDNFRIQIFFLVLLYFVASTFCGIFELSHYYYKAPCIKRVINIKLFMDLLSGYTLNIHVNKLILAFNQFVFFLKFYNKFHCIVLCL